ncbi:MAG TPA: hypothetical protein VEJ87_02580 [Acidimicrobiales bacterium]|nr:hypothetical protein [Acidimicrobiales bacterium]
MPILDASHDLAHPVESDLAWSESYYFNAYDPPSDSGFFTRIGIRPCEGTADVSLSVWIPGDGVGEYRAVRDERGMPDTELTVGAVTFRMSEPMSRWHISMAADASVRTSRRSETNPRQVPVELEATFDALTPAVGTDGRGSGHRSSEAASAAASSVGKGHLEQAGRWTGSVTVDGERHEFTDARGNRDKSWGPRRWGGPLMWRWFSINVGDDLHFGGIRIGTAAGDLHRGWVWDGENATGVTKWDLRTETEEDGITHKETKVIASDKLGRRHELQADILRVASVRSSSSSQRSTLLNEGLARWNYCGRTGYGIVEYLHQLDSSGRPTVAVE